MSGPFVTAVVEQTLPNARFLCRVDGGREVLCHVAKNARMEFVRLLPGEEVLVEPSPLDPGKGRIVKKKARSGS